MWIIFKKSSLKPLAFLGGRFYFFVYLMEEFLSLKRKIIKPIKIKRQILSINLNRKDGEDKCKDLDGILWMSKE